MDSNNNIDKEIEHSVRIINIIYLFEIWMRWTSYPGINLTFPTWLDWVDLLCIIAAIIFGRGTQIATITYVHLRNFLLYLFECRLYMRGIYFFIICVTFDHFLFV